MENATKALIIAAAILIAIVLISLGVFVLGNGTQLVKENSDMTGTQVASYNSEFEAYFGDKVSGSKVKQLVNILNQHNRNAEDDSKQIELSGTGVTGEKTGTQRKSFAFIPNCIYNSDVESSMFARRKRRTLEVEECTNCCWFRIRKRY